MRKTLRVINILTIVMITCVFFLFFLNCYVGPLVRQVYYTSSNDIVYTTKYSQDAFSYFQAIFGTKCKNKYSDTGKLIEINENIINFNPVLFTCLFLLVCIFVFSIISYVKREQERDNIAYHIIHVAIMLSILSFFNIGLLVGFRVFEQNLDNLEKIYGTIYMRPFSIDGGYFVILSVMSILLLIRVANLIIFILYKRKRLDTL